MKMKFTFYWLSGDREVFEGNSINEALRNAGYGGGALGVLDFWANGDDNNYKFENKKWIKK